MGGEIGSAHLGAPEVLEPLCECHQLSPEGT